MIKTKLFFKALSRSLLLQWNSLMTVSWRTALKKQKPEEKVLKVFDCLGENVNMLSVCVSAQSLQSCLTLCDPMKCSQPVSLSMVILQARILEWVLIPSSRGSSWPRDWTHVSYLLHWQAGSLPLVPPNLGPQEKRRQNGEERRGEERGRSRASQFGERHGSLGKTNEKKWLFFSFWGLFPSLPLPAKN